MSRLRIAFAGTPEFATTILQALLDEPDFEVVAVITQPDMPLGRKQIITASAVKALALAHRLPCLQPQRISQSLDELTKLDLDFLVVAAYAQLIPVSVLKLAKYGPINVHASLLPKYRGAAVVQAALLNNDADTGVTIMEMVEKLDAGAILAQAKLKIMATDNSETLMLKLANLGAPLLVATMKSIIQHQLRPRVQDESLASYCPRLTKADGLIDWTKTAPELDCFIRAMYPWPSAWTWLNGKQLKILAVKSMETLEIHTAGKIFVFNNTLAIQTGQGALVIAKLQPEGKRVMSGQEFLNGNHEAIGSILG